WVRDGVTWALEGPDINLQLSDWFNPVQGLLSRWRKVPHWLYVRLRVPETSIVLAARVPNGPWLDGVPDQQHEDVVEVPLQPLVDFLETALFFGAVLARAIVDDRPS